jgi:hypothetical protein
LPGRNISLPKIDFFTRFPDMRAKQFFGLVLIALMVGCSGGAENTVVESAVPPAEQQMRSLLENLAKTGESMGSGGQIIMEALENIKKTDQAKGDSMQADADKLMTTSNPAEIKKLAASLLEKL